ncbi:Demethylmenaquinone methyltransferase [Symmachiella dynata]|uniref:Demethylmenaquinone methyltransferase n=2 Tax=Symmachiella dynata TaxID=2527995 RepID=A0A517ZNZ5_9PLAN|nr:class I SAM-dependent methyltransferase [Symmachiella dynata]QDT48551.1 Demethylmenaquinone methyltransferase [Symmachiella dynata]QDU44140.1 Demethylmenaquinone methyltransferase [Symmachiella dynata]
MATQQPESPSQRRKRKRALRKLVEFKGMHGLSLNQYRQDVKQLYDGPKGAMLAMASLVSLHEPLVGLMFRERKFDATRFHKILDIGAGAGQILGHLVKRTNPTAELIGCDLSHQMLRRARTRLDSDRPNYVTADLTQLPFADDSFDCITCGWVIEHLHDPRPGLREFVRVLQPGGSMLLLATEDTVAGALTSRTWKCRTYNRRELNSMCEEVGLPWQEQLYFTKLHRFFKLGGILVEATKQAHVELAPPHVCQS